MKLVKKHSLYEFLESIPEDEKQIQNILSEGRQASYERSNYDLFVSWLMLIMADLDNGRESRVKNTVYNKWNGTVEKTISAYGHEIYVTYHPDQQLQEFSFFNIEYNANTQSNISLLMKPMVENLIKKVNDKNGSV
jgi:hypothetical protein